MTKRQVWQACAEYFKQREERGRGYGICAFLCDQVKYGKITLRLYKQLSSKLYLYARERQLSLCRFFWPLTPRGDAARVRFCQAQVKKLDEAKAGKSAKKR